MHFLIHNKQHKQIKHIFCLFSLENFQVKVLLKEYQEQNMYEVVKCRKRNLCISSIIYELSLAFRNKKKQINVCRYLQLQFSMLLLCFMCSLQHNSILTFAFPTFLLSANGHFCGFVSRSQKTVFFLFLTFLCLLICMSY